MGHVPSQKGTSVLPVVAALRAHPERNRLVPRELWKYFDEPLLLSGWYPERDYWVLVDALVKTIDPARVGNDVWRYFAKFSAQRDIAGQDVNGREIKAANAGMYRNFAALDPSDPERFFRRATKLWSQYHDSGRLEIIGARPAAHAVVMCLTQFVIPIEGFVLLQGYYFEEYGRLVGLELSSRVTRSTASNDAYCEWELKLAHSPLNDAYLASLPLV